MQFPRRFEFAGHALNEFADGAWPDFGKTLQRFARSGAMPSSAISVTRRRVRSGPLYFASSRATAIGILLVVALEPLDQGVDAGIRDH